MLRPVRLSYVIAAFDYGNLTLQVHRSLLASRLVSAFRRLWLVNTIAIQPGCCLSCGRPVVELHPLIAASNACFWLAQHLAYELRALGQERRREPGSGKPSVLDWHLRLSVASLWRIAHGAIF